MCLVKNDTKKMFYLIIMAFKRTGTSNPVREQYMKRIRYSLDSNVSSDDSKGLDNNDSSDDSKGLDEDCSERDITIRVREQIQHHDVHFYNFKYHLFAMTREEWLEWGYKFVEKIDFQRIVECDPKYRNMLDFTVPYNEFQVARHYLERGPNELFDNPYVCYLTLQKLCCSHADTLLDRWMEDLKSGVLNVDLYTTENFWSLVLLSAETKPLEHVKCITQIASLWKSLVDEPTTIEEEWAYDILQRALCYIQPFMVDDCDRMYSRPELPHACQFTHPAVCLAGGAAWYLYHESVIPKTSDIDYFIVDHEQAETVVSEFVRFMSDLYPHAYWVVKRCVITVIPHDNVNNHSVQLIMTDNDSSSTVQHVLGAFDIECCQIAVYLSNIVTTRAFRMAEDRERIVTLGVESIDKHRIKKWLDRTGYKLVNIQSLQSLQSLSRSSKCDDEPTLSKNGGKSFEDPPHARFDYQIPDGNPRPQETIRVLKALHRTKNVFFSGDQKDLVESVRESFAYRAIASSMEYLKHKSQIPLFDYTFECHRCSPEIFRPFPMHFIRFTGHHWKMQLHGLFFGVFKCKGEGNLRRIEILMHDDSRKRVVDVNSRLYEDLSTACKNYARRPDYENDDLFLYQDTTTIALNGTRVKRPPEMEYGGISVTFQAFPLYVSFIGVKWFITAMSFRHIHLTVV
jgi:hypothetical protein